MYCLLATVTVTLTVVSVVTCQLPCNSQLRLLPAYSHLFAHCRCTYNEWSEWSVFGSTPVPASQCATERVVMEERQRTVISGNCDPITEERVICEAGVVEQLILGLGLGSRGQNTIGALRGVNDNNRGPTPSDYCSGTEQVCHHVTTPNGKRSVREELKRPHTSSRRRSAAEATPLAVDPTQFNITEHGARYRRQSQTCAGDTQYILFILDTSSSIGEAEFNRLTNVISELVLFFCQPIKVAVMTFDHDYFVEFCFNCFDNTCGGRTQTRNTIRSIDHTFGRSGFRYTYTGGAAKCACDFMLSSSCGVAPTADCIDVVFITDGRSNDPSSDVCSDVLCLHNRFGVTTYAIGIADAYHIELECITDADPGEFHLFNFQSFSQFEATLQQVTDVLLTGGIDPNGDPYVCIDPRGSTGLGSVGCVGK